MDKAFVAVVGREMDCESDEDLALWNAAWNLARVNNYQSVAMIPKTEIERTYRFTKISDGSQWVETYTGSIQTIAADIDEELHRYGLELSDVTIREVAGDGMD